MIERIVFYKLQAKDRVQRQQHLAQLHRLFNAARGEVPGLFDIEFGVDIAGKQNHDCAVTLRFVDEEAISLFDGHKAHDRIEQALHGIVEDVVVVECAREVGEA